LDHHREEDEFQLPISRFALREINLCNQARKFIWKHEYHEYFVPTSLKLNQRDWEIVPELVRHLGVWTAELSNPYSGQIRIRHGTVLLHEIWGEHGAYSAGISTKNETN